MKAISKPSRVSSTGRPSSSASRRILRLTAEQVERGLFADLKSEQKLIRFQDITPERLLQHYNVALAQAVLLKAMRVHVTINNEPPQRYRQLLRQLKFHRLLCEMERAGPDSHVLHLDGPLSLFSATQKYGLQLALFLPTVLLCKNFEVKAELRWGPQKKPKTFVLTHKDRLVSHAADSGMWVPPELQMFVDSFRKRIADWELSRRRRSIPLGSGFWVPDFRLVHRARARRSCWKCSASGESPAPRSICNISAATRKSPSCWLSRTSLHIEETDSRRPSRRHPPLPQHAAGRRNRQTGRCGDRSEMKERICAGPKGGHGSGEGNRSCHGCVSRVGRNARSRRHLLRTRLTQPLHDRLPSAPGLFEPGRRVGSSGTYNCFSAISSARSSPRALFIVSSHSLAGMLSATMPAPACR